MSRKQHESTRDAGSFPAASVALAAAAFAVNAGFLAWAFLQPGTLGMYRWGYSLPVLGLLGLGTLPLVLALASAVAGRRPGRGEPNHGSGAGSRAAKAVGVAASVLAIVALLVGLGASLYALSRAYGRLPAASERPIVLDPSRGLPPRVGPDGSPAFRIAISSDPHFDGEASAGEARRAILRNAQAEASEGRLDAFVVLGDFVELGMEPSGWAAALSELRAYAPSVPFLALMGNHDSLIGGARRWRAAMGPWGASARVPKGALSASSWRLDAGTVHLLSIDLLWGAEGFGARERAWLSAQLDSIPKEDITIVLSHSFIYSSGYVDGTTGKPWYDQQALIRGLVPLLAGRADLVVSGHNHYMEWIESGGTAYAVVGAMGGKPDPEPSYRSPGSAWFDRGAYGSLVLELVPGGMSCSFVDERGSVLFSRTVR